MTVSRCCRLGGRGVQRVLLHAHLTGHGRGALRVEAATFPRQPGLQLQSDHDAGGHRRGRGRHHRKGIVPRPGGGLEHDPQWRRASPQGFTVSPQELGASPTDPSLVSVPVPSLSGPACVPVPALSVPLSPQADLFYSSKEQQAQLLQKVLAATDTDAEDEQMIGETGRPGDR